jgi:hypothetical protein
MSESKNSARRIEAAERRTKALELRKAGHTFKAIGQALGCSEQRAHKIVTKELARLNSRRAEQGSEVTRLELERLDALHAALWLRAIKGDLDAFDRVLRLMQRRAALLGLDAPTKREVAGPNGQPFKVYLGGFSPEEV